MKGIYMSVKESYEKRKQKEEVAKRLTKGVPAQILLLTISMGNLSLLTP